MRDAFFTHAPSPLTELLRGALGDRGWRGVPGMQGAMHAQSRVEFAKEAQFSGGWEGDLDLHGAFWREVFVEPLAWQAEVVECPGLVLNFQFHGLAGLATENRRLEVVVVSFQVYLGFAAYILRTMIRGRDIAGWNCLCPRLRCYRGCGARARLHDELAWGVADWDGGCDRMVREVYY